MIGRQRATRGVAQKGRELLRITVSELELGVRRQILIRRDANHEGPSRAAIPKSVGRLRGLHQTPLRRSDAQLS